MHYYHDHALETMIKGWTRIDMLLALYDRTITSIQAVQTAEKENDTNLVAIKMLDVNRLLLGLHSGLNTDDYPIASDVARLLNFVAMRLEEKNYEEAVYFLEKLHQGFSKIRDEAADMEKKGKIPPLAEPHSLNTIA